MKCFVIMPFGDPHVDPEATKRFTSLYQHWIKPTVESIEVAGSRLACHRADREFSPGEIVSHIIDNLVNSEVAIADLTGRSPNVFYELGVRHAVNNNTILIASNSSDIPFDLRNQRTILYNYDPDSLIELREKLAVALGEVLKEPNRVDNPVRRYLMDREVQKLASSAAPPGYDAVKDVLNELSRLRGEFDRHMGELRHILRLVTAPAAQPELDVSGGPGRHLDLRELEGVWVKPDRQGTYCIKTCGDTLLIPYSYHGRDALEAHVLNVRILGDTLFGRFEWFDGSNTGYLYLRSEGPDSLRGGWWYASDDLFDRSGNLVDFGRELAAVKRFMVDLHLVRAESNEYPDWARRYFLARGVRV